MNLFKKMALGCAVVLLSASQALAVDVKEEVSINAPVDAVWAKIGGWCAIKDWHPAVIECEEITEGDVTRRKLTLDGGGTIMERLTGTADNSYSYVIEESPLPVANYAATIKVEADGDNSKVTWSSTFDAKDKTDSEAAEIISGVYKGGFEALVNDMKK